MRRVRRVRDGCIAKRKKKKKKKKKCECERYCTVLLYMRHDAMRGVHVPWGPGRTGHARATIDRSNAD